MFYGSILQPKFGGTFKLGFHIAIFSIFQTFKKICTAFDKVLMTSLNILLKWKFFWDDLENYRPLPCYKCSFACSWGIVESVKTYREQDYVIWFLKGLNERFAHSRPQIMMMNPLLDIDKSFSLVIRQKCELNSNVPIYSPKSTITSPHGSAHNNSNGKGIQFNKGRGFYSSTKGVNRVCTHCGQTNDTVGICFLKHEYPPVYRQRGKISHMAKVLHKLKWTILEMLLLYLKVHQAPRLVLLKKSFKVFVCFFNSRILHQRSIPSPPLLLFWTLTHPPTLIRILNFRF